MSEKKPLLLFKDVHVEVEGKEVVSGASLTINAGEIHAIMGPNGSGKSSLSNALMGHPSYEITKGEAYLAGENLLEMEPDERSRAGLFLAFQYPVAIPGVTVANFMRAALQSHRGKDADMTDFRKLFLAEMAELDIEKARRDPPDGHAETEDGPAGRDRLRPRYRRSQNGI